MREEAKENLKTFALTADVSEANSQVPTDERDWYLLGCQVRPGDDVYVNTVGTFVVASASYHRSRVASAIGQLSQYLVRRPTRGTCLSPTTATWKQAEPLVVKLLCPQSSRAPPVVFRCHGTKLQMEIRWCGWASLVCGRPFLRLPDKFLVGSPPRRQSRSGQACKRGPHIVESLTPIFVGR